MSGINRFSSCSGSNRYLPSSRRAQRNPPVVPSRELYSTYRNLCMRLNIPACPSARPLRSDGRVWDLPPFHHATGHCISPQMDGSFSSPYLASISERIPGVRTRRFTIRRGGWTAGLNLSLPIPSSSSRSVRDPGEHKIVPLSITLTLLYQNLSWSGEQAWTNFIIM